MAGLAVVLQALMAFAGEASAQVVLVAGEGIGDGDVVVRWCGSGRRNPGLAACVPDAERGYASIAVTAPDTGLFSGAFPLAVASPSGGFAWVIRKRESLGAVSISVAVRQPLWRRSFLSRLAWATQRPPIWHSCSE
jgi:hypothetical protein